MPPVFPAAKEHAAGTEVRAWDGAQQPGPGQLRAAPVLSKQLGTGAAAVLHQGGWAVFLSLLVFSGGEGRNHSLSARAL